MDVLAIIMVVWVIQFLFMAVSWFVFTRVSIPRIDRKMEEGDRPKACPVDVFGTRALFIANAISLPLLNSENPIIDGKTVCAYSTRFDRRVALILSVSTYLFGVTGVIGGMLLPDS